MSLALIEARTQAQEERYGAFLLALRGVADAFVDSPHVGSVLAHRELEDRTRLLLDRTRADMSEQLYEDTRALADAARRTVSEALGASLAQEANPEFALALRERLVAATRAVESRLEYALDTTAHGTKTALRRLALRAAMLARQRGWALRAAVVSIRERERAQLKSTVADRAGREWDAQRYVRTLLRGHYLSVYNELVLAELALRGEQTARIVIDGEGERRLAVVPGAEPGLPSYDELAAELFHPNGKAVLAPESK